MKHFQWYTPDLEAVRSPAQLGGKFFSRLLLLTFRDLFVPRGDEVGVHLENVKFWLKGSAVHIYISILFTMMLKLPIRNEVGYDDVHCGEVH